MGGVKYQPFLKHINHWKRALKMNFKRSGCSQFFEAVVTSTVKESLHSTERGSIQVLADSYKKKLPSRKKVLCTIVTNFCSEGKVML